MASRGIKPCYQLCRVWLLIFSLSMLSLAVLPSKPTLKQWHRQTSELKESAENAFDSCPIHVKCLAGNSQWMTDKLEFVLRFNIDLNKVRTIYDSRNQSALIPTTEHCSLHYILSSYDTNWSDVYEYVNYKIQKFIVRRTFQTALINVIEWSPLSFPTRSLSMIPKSKNARAHPTKAKFRKIDFP
jgi:hypothetical protein